MRSLKLIKEIKIDKCMMVFQERLFPERNFSFENASYDCKQ